MSIHNKRVIPRLTILEADEIHVIHRESIKVMEQIGVHVFETHALKLLNDAGARVDGPRVYIPEKMLMQALDSVPKSISIFNRDGEAAMYLEPGRNYFGTGSDTTYFIDPASDKRKESDLQNIAIFARLVDALPNIDFAMSMGNTPELCPDIRDQQIFSTMVEHTTKPICFTAQTGQAMEDIIRIATIVLSGEQMLREKPFAVLYAMPHSPLVHTREALQVMLLAAQSGIPCVYASGAMNGGTCPITVAGGLVVSNTEILTGLIIHQLQHPGAPFIYGGIVTPLDMRTTVCIYAGPEAGQSQIGSLDLADFYRLPSFATGGCTDSKVFDQQAASEAAITLMYALLAGGNMIHDVGYCESGLCASRDLVVYADEIIEELRRLVKGVEVTEETLSFDVIKRVGIGGNYFSDEQTLERYKKDVWYPHLRDRRSYSDWITVGDQKNHAQRVREQLLQIQDTHTVKPLSSDIQGELRRILER